MLACSDLCLSRDENNFSDLEQEMDFFCKKTTTVFVLLIELRFCVFKHSKHLHSCFQAGASYSTYTFESLKQG